MKKQYKGCTIEVKREMNMVGDLMLFYSVFTNQGEEITSGFSYGIESVREFADGLKVHVDEFLGCVEIEGWA